MEFVKEQGIRAKRSSGFPAPGRRLPAVERRQQLFDVALSLFSEKGYVATTMDEIAEAAGVTKPLLYQHFSSKRALYLELVKSVAETLLNELQSAVAKADGPRQQVEYGLAAYFSFVIQHEPAFRLLYGRNEGDFELGQALRNVEDAIARSIEPLMTAGIDKEHREYLAYAVVGMTEGASRAWLARRSTPSIKNEEDPKVQAHRLAQRMADLAWAGLRSVHPDNLK